jgi:hypothetical protein
MTDLHDILERALEKDRTMRIQKEPESMEFDTEGITEPAEVIVDLGIGSDEGEDVDEDIDDGNGGTVGFVRVIMWRCSRCASILMQTRLN